MYSIGIDSGSRKTKLCLYNIATNEIISCHQEDTLYNFEKQIDDMIENQFRITHLDKHLLHSIICTGYGRKNYSKATMSISEIICHAKGVYEHNKNIKTVLDIGGQDFKIIKLSENGKVIDFVMNDKCAAGTGGFLEKVSQYFKINWEDLSAYSELSDKNIEISSTCVVFAESEIIGLVSSGEKKENIIKAVHASIVHRLLSLSGSIPLQCPVAFVGGVAKSPCMVKTLSQYLNHDVYVPEKPEFTGALGAALSWKK